MVHAVNAIDKFNKAVQWLAVRASANMHVHELLLHVSVSIQSSLEWKLRSEGGGRIEEEHHDASDSKGQLKGSDVTRVQNMVG